MPYKFLKLGIGSSVISNNGKALKKLGDSPSLPQLEPPTISISGDTLTITDGSGLAAGFEILVGGEIKETITTSAFDLTTLDLPSGTHNISAISIPGYGYTRSVEGNVVVYEIDEIVGVWVFNDTIQSPLTKDTVDNYKPSVSTTQTLCGWNVKLLSGSSYLGTQYTSIQFRSSLYVGTWAYSMCYGTQTAYEFYEMDSSGNITLTEDRFYGGSSWNFNTIKITNQNYSAFGGKIAGSVLPDFKTWLKANATKIS